MSKPSDDGPSTLTQCAVRLSYLRQKWTLPIVLSPENNEILALYSIIIPSTALALGYQFILKPRRRAQRAKYVNPSPNLDALLNGGDSGTLMLLEER